MADDTDLALGQLIAAAASAPKPTRDLVATVCWLSHTPLSKHSRLLLKHTTRTTAAIIGAMDGVLDLDDVAIGRLRIRTIHLTQLGALLLGGLIAAPIAAHLPGCSALPSAA